MMARNGRDSRGVARVALIFLGLMLCVAPAMADASLGAPLQQGIELRTNDGTVSVEPPCVNAVMGVPITLYVTLTDVVDIYGIDLTISYDPAVVDIAGGRLAPMWEVFDASDHFVFDNVAAEGAIHYAVFNINPAEPFSGSGRVCAITVTPLRTGQALLDITFAKGSTRDADPLWPQQVDGLVCVGAPCPTEAPTSTPTVEPTRPDNLVFLPLLWR